MSSSLSSFSMNNLNHLHALELVKIRYNRCLCVILLLCYISIYSGGQNLVSNYSFELDTNCVDENKRSPDHWPSLLGQSPDVYIGTKCRYSSATSYHGKQFAGFYCSIPIYTSSFYEYLHSELTNKLLHGHKYYFEMHVRLQSDAQYAYDQMGVVLLPDVDSSRFRIMNDDGSQPDVFLKTTPTISSPVGQLLIDTSEWTRISGVFTSSGNELHLVVGFFTGHEELNWTTLNELGPTQLRLEYLIDHVWLVDIQDIVCDTIEVCQDIDDLSYTVAPPEIYGLPYSMEWYDGDTSFTKDFTVSGQYGFTLYADDLPIPGQLTVRINPGALETEETFTLCAGDTLQIEAQNADLFDQFRWSNGVTSSAIQITAPGEIWLEASNTCNTYTNYISIVEEQCGCEVFVPNAFSPNNDGVNDLFEPHFSCTESEITEYQISIFDRWGSLMYSGSEMDNKWDGRFNGNDAPSGSYTWMLKYNEDGKGGSRQEDMLSGSLMLIR